MKAVLISIQPKWCELIASGKKTVEVRKTKPKIDVPFKCYIYCTKAKEHFSIGGGVYATSDTLYRLPTGELKLGDGFELMGDWSGQHDESNFLNGKVIGEFVCDKVAEIKSDAVYSKVFGGFDVRFNFDKYASCLTEEQIVDYLGEGKGYAWYISNLVIYDQPEELSGFYKKCKSFDKDEWENDDCLECENPCGNGGKLYLKRPPQGWCYVEEVNR